MIIDFVSMLTKTRRVQTSPRKDSGSEYVFNKKFFISNDFFLNIDRTI